MELLRSTSRGGFFVRSIFTLVATALLTALLAAIALSPIAKAEDPKAAWKGDSIIFNGQQYFAAPPAKSGESHGLPADTQYYLSVEEVSQRPLVRKAHVIYFAPGNSPPEATSATYVVYNYSSSDTFSNPQSQKTITITPQGEEGSYSSCSVDGIGWFICPITVFLAEAMDTVFDLVSGFVAVQPLVVNDTNSPLYQAWNVMRSIANIAFIIAFLIIIYSQVTSVGLTNYSLKKLLPRLVVAAILVNISFYVTAIAVDISNIAGYSLQEILISIRQETFSITNGTWSADATNGWSSLTAFVLSGGAIAGGYIGLATATGGSIGAAIYLLVPLLVALLLTILFVLLILAARQAIIIILIVVAPLAFVANLLPNTEKWFEKWKDLFMTMLIFFPAFSLVFGGSQLAGGIIVQNANNIIMMIFGMAVQIAPLIITPLLLKLSGGLLGRIGGLINDPRRGALDRTKNWSKDRANMHRAKSLGNTKPGLGRANPFRRTAQSMDNKQRHIKDMTAVYEQDSENRYHNTDKHAKAFEAKHNTETNKKIIDSRVTRDLDRKISTSPQHMEHQIRASVMEDQASLAKSTLDAGIAEARSGNRPRTLPTSYNSQNLDHLLASAKGTAIESSAQKLRLQSAEGEVQKAVAEAFSVRLKDDKSNLDAYVASQGLLQVAGGVDPSGMIRAQSNAVSALEKIRADARENNMKLLTTRAVHEGKTTPKNFAVDILTKRYQGDISESDEIIRAALEIAGDEAQIPLLRKIRTSSNFEQDDVTEMLIRKSGIMKAKGAFDLQNDFSLANATPERMDVSIAGALGSSSATDFAGLKFGAIKDYSVRIDDIVSNTKAETDPKYQRDALEGLKKTYFNITNALKDPEIIATLGDNLEPMLTIHKKLHSEYGHTDKAIDYDALDPLK